MNKLKKFKDDIISFIKFSSSSLVTTGLDLVIYSLSIDYLEKLFPIFYTFIATITARIFSDSLKYHIDKHVVFYSNEKYGYYKYMFIAIMKTLTSASIVTFIAAIGIEYEEAVKMITDVILFFPGYILSKVWVHRR